MSQYFDLNLLIAYHTLFLRGLANTVMLTAVAMTAGLVLGLPVGLARLTASRLVRYPATVFVGLLRNTPILVQLFFFQAFAPLFLGISNSPVFVACFAFAIYNIAYCSDIFRGGIKSIEIGQVEASRSLGMNRLQQLRYIVVPQAFRRMIPAFTNRSIEVAKLTTVASAVAYGDLLYYAKLVSDIEYRPIETYTVVALLFIVVLIPFSILAKRLERHLAASK